MSSYLDEMGRELSAAGVTGKTRARILTEFKDHLECDPKAQLGAPRELARQFADELGTSRVRRSAAATFAALSLAGILFAAMYATAQFGALYDVPSKALARIAAVVLVVGAQVAFATGMLAGLRTLQFRRADSMPRAEAIVIMRRAAVALIAGIVTMAGLALAGAELHPDGAIKDWGTFVQIAAAVGGLALLAAAPMVLAAATSLPTGDGEAGDIFEDVGPFLPAGWRARPWRFALLFAAAIGLAVALAGVAASDPFDGIFRGIAEMTACLIGFAILGPYLGLWSRKPIGA